MVFRVLFFALICVAANFGFAWFTDETARQAFRDTYYQVSGVVMFLLINYQGMIRARRSNN